MTTGGGLDTFFAAYLDYREELRQRVSLLSDDELNGLLGVIGHDRLATIPWEFWTVLPPLRVFIKKELERRARKVAAIGGQPDHA